MTPVPLNIVPIKNAINFRDLGGLKTVDGRTIRPGLLYRAGAFCDINQSEADYLADKLNIKIILDYRDKSEIEHRPDNLWNNAIYINVPANPLNDDVSASLTSAVDDADAKMLKKHYPADFMIKLYQLLPFDNEAYHKLTDLLLNTNGKSIVQHCAVGKDRTGVGVALTLFALGVSEETVITDYLQTEHVLENYRKKLLNKFSNTLNDAELESYKQIFAAKKEYLSAALTAIKNRYQSVDNWLAEEYQLTEKNKQIIRANYLE